MLHAQQMLNQMLNQLLNQMLRMMLKQKKKEAENTILHILFFFFFAPVFVQFNAPIYSCILCLPTFVFLSVMLRNFVLFGILVRRSCKTGIQPHNVYNSRTTVQVTLDGTSDITLDAQIDDQNA